MNGRRGYTLLEMTVSIGLGSAIALGALTLTADFNRFQHRHLGELGADQRLRDSLDLIAQDIRNAGVGVGYRPDGEYAGFITGNFSLPGGAVFDATNRVISTSDGNVLTDDLGLRRALGDRRTVLFLEEGTGQICTGLEFESGDRVAVTSRSGRSGKTLRILGSSPTPCTRGVCSGGCASITWAADPAYVSSPAATTQLFVGGDLYQDYETVVWFVSVDDEGFPSLRRVSGDRIYTCATAGETCGGEAAEGVVFLHYAVARLDATSGAWVAVSQDQPIRSFEPLRVDIEMIARSKSDPGVGLTQSVSSDLEPGLCAPAHCGNGELDTVPRLALRTSVEVRNAGRLTIR